MKLHRNAKLSVKGRELLVDRTARKWLARYRAEGPDGLLDRSSAPAVVANCTDKRRIEQAMPVREGPGLWMKPSLRAGWIQLNGSAK